jgi:phosphate transport system protein
MSASTARHIDSLDKFSAATEREELLQLTLKACETAGNAVAQASIGVGSANNQALDLVMHYERELDRIDREVDQRVTACITRVSQNEARELLACMKFVVDLERIGDLLSSFAARGKSVAARLDTDDLNDLIRMAMVLEQMLADSQTALAKRDLDRAVAVLRADGEIDRLRNLIFIRQLESAERTQDSVQLLFMAQALERAGDHAKNLAEEVCHLVSGTSVRHTLRQADKPYEQMFLDWLRNRGR